MAGDLIGWALGVHGIVLPLSLAGLYRYRDRRELFTKAVGDADELLARLRGVIAQALEDELEPVFQRSEGEPTIVQPNRYSERSTNPVGSEAYREALRRFIDSDVEVVIDYGRASRARTTSYTWARLLSWTMLGLAFWEVVCVVALGLVERLFEVKIPDDVVKWSFAPAVGLVGFFFVCQLLLLRQDDVIHESTSRYSNL
jgi:hypothetical protein